MKLVLFLCTGNYYRSRYAEELFNHLAAKCGLDWIATSRALAIERGKDNEGPIAFQTLDALAADKILPEGHKRLPLPCTDDDLASANLIIAVKEAEHRELLRDRHTGWQDRVVYWHIHDVDVAPPDVALGELKDFVVTLVQHVLSDTCSNVANFKALTDATRDFYSARMPRSMI